jgi:hypothetical protein
MATPTEDRLQVAAQLAYHRWQAVELEARLAPVPPELAGEVARLVELHHRRYLMACQRFSDECKKTTLSGRRAAANGPGG